MLRGPTPLTPEEEVEVARHRCRVAAGRAERGGLRKDEFYDRFADLEAMLAARDAA